MLTIYTKFISALHSFKNNEQGVTAIEYAIIGVAISGIVLTVFNGPNGLETALTDAVATISSNITAAN